jgi:hypothetical protein
LKHPSSKSYIVYDSKKDCQYIIDNLSNFCKENCYDVNTVRGAVSRKRQAHYKGLFIKPLYSERDLKKEFEILTNKTLCVKEKKEKVPKHVRYNQSEKSIYFQNNVKEIYEKYHVKNKLSYRQISKIFEWNSESVRLQFKKHNLPLLNNFNGKTGTEHYAYLNLKGRAKTLIDDFENLFVHEHYFLNKSVKTISQEYDINCTTIFNYCRKYNIKYESKNVSFPHYKITQLLDSLNIEYFNNVRNIIKPKELDIWIPSLNVAIEINGLFWHSKLDRNYHLNKLKQCEKQKIHLLQFWDCEIYNKFNIVKSIILAKLNKSDKIYARNTSIKKLSYSDIKIFLENNHIQGNRTSSINYGLFYDNKLKMVASFNKHKKYQYELIRLCSLTGLVIVGGAEKLMKNFINEYNPGYIMSFCDKRLFQGKVYEKLKFEFIKDTSPNYWYFQDDILESRQKYQKHKQSNVLVTFDCNLTEYENMTNNNFKRVYDCGSKMYIKQLENIK